MNADQMHQRVFLMVDAFQENARRVTEDDVMAQMANAVTSFTLGVAKLDATNSELYRAAFILFMMGYRAAEENWGLLDWDLPE